MLARLLLIATICAVSACAPNTTGGTIGGLVPAPKFLKGEITNDIYTAQDKSFSVAVPHKSDSYEYKYMQVKEMQSPYGAYVSFGPAAFDQGVYRVEIGKRVTASSASVKFDDVAPKMIESYKSQLEKAYGGPLNEVASRDDTINGRHAHYWRLSQNVPAGKYAADKDAVFMHEVYVIDFGSAATIVWLQIPETTKRPAIEPRAFAESLVIH